MLWGDVFRSRARGVEGPVEGDDHDLHPSGLLPHLVPGPDEKLYQGLLPNHEEPRPGSVVLEVEQQGVGGGDDFLGTRLHPQAGELGRVVGWRLERLVGQVDDAGEALELGERLFGPRQQMIPEVDSAVQVEHVAVEEPVGRPHSPPPASRARSRVRSTKASSHTPAKKSRSARVKRLRMRWQLPSAQRATSGATGGSSSPNRAGAPASRKE